MAAEYEQNSVLFLILGISSYIAYEVSGDEPIVLLAATGLAYLVATYYAWWLVLEQFRGKIPARPTGGEE